MPFETIEILSEVVFWIRYVLEEQLYDTKND